jgi:hypothetical protein
MYIKGNILWLKVNNSSDKSHKREQYGEVEWFVWILLLTWLVVLSLYGEQNNSGAVLMKVLISFTVAAILDFLLINIAHILNSTV